MYIKNIKKKSILQILEMYTYIRTMKNHIELQEEILVGLHTNLLLAFNILNNNNINTKTFLYRSGLVT